MPKYRIEYETTALAAVTIEADDEEQAYDEAVTLIKERLDQIAAPDAHGVAVHMDIDGLEGQVAEVDR